MKKVLTFYVGLCFITLSYAQNENPQSKQKASSPLKAPEQNSRTTTKSSTSIIEKKYVKLEGNVMRLDEVKAMQNKSNNPSKVTKHK